MVDFASQEGARAVLVTFWPHPRNILRPEEPIHLLTTREEKLELLAGLGCLDTVLVMPFTSELAQLTPQAYLEVLNKYFKLQGLIEGEDFTFGYNRTGTMTWLRCAGKEAGFAVRTTSVVENGNRISSTRIREYIASGRVEEAAELLGRPYTLAGTVIHGDRLGRQLGYPTAICISIR